MKVTIPCSKCGVLVEDDTKKKKKVVKFYEIQILTEGGKTWSVLRSFVHFEQLREKIIQFFGAEISASNNNSSSHKRFSSRTLQLPAGVKASVAASVRRAGNSRASGTVAYSPSFRESNNGSSSGGGSGSASLRRSLSHGLGIYGDLYHNHRYDGDDDDNNDADEDDQTFVPRLPSSKMIIGNIGRLMRKKRRVELEEFLQKCVAQDRFLRTAAFPAFREFLEVDVKLLYHAPNKLYSEVEKYQIQEKKKKNNSNNSSADQQPGSPEAGHASILTIAITPGAGGGGGGGSGSRLGSGGPFTPRGRTGSGERSLSILTGFDNNNNSSSSSNNNHGSEPRSPGTNKLQQQQQFPMMLSGAFLSAASVMSCASPSSASMSSMQAVCTSFRRPGLEIPFDVWIGIFAFLGGSEVVTTWTLVCRFFHRRINNGATKDDDTSYHLNHHHQLWKALIAADFGARTVQELEQAFMLTLKWEQYCCAKRKLSTTAKQLPFHPVPERPNSNNNNNNSSKVQSPALADELTFFYIYRKLYEFADSWDYFKYSTTKDTHAFLAERRSVAVSDALYLKDHNERREMKVVLVSHGAVGKTSFYESYGNEHLHTLTSNTIGAVFMNRTIFVRDEAVKMALWDTAGQEKLSGLLPLYIANSDAIILMYSIADETSFFGMRNLIFHALNLSTPCRIIIVGGQCDLDEDDDQGEHQYQRQHQPQLSPTPSSAPQLNDNNDDDDDDDKNKKNSIRSLASTNEQQIQQDLEALRMLFAKPELVVTGSRSGLSDSLLASPSSASTPSSFSSSSSSSTSDAPKKQRRAIPEWFARSLVRFLELRSPGRLYDFMELSCVTGQNVREVIQCVGEAYVDCTTRYSSGKASKSKLQL